MSVSDEQKTLLQACENLELCYPVFPAYWLCFFSLSCSRYFLTCKRPQFAAWGKG